MIENFADKVNTVVGRLLVLLVVGYLGVVVLVWVWLDEMLALIMLQLGVVSLVISIAATLILWPILRFIWWFLFHGLD